MLAIRTCHHAERIISGGVSESVVIAFEVIDIDHHYRERTLPPPGAMEFALECLLHVAAIVESGEWVADGLS